MVPPTARPDRGPIDQRTVWIEPQPGQTVPQPGNGYKPPASSNAAAPVSLIIGVCRLLQRQPFENWPALFENGLEGFELRNLPSLEYIYGQRFQQLSIFGCFLVGFIAKRLRSFVRRMTTNYARLAYVEI